MLVRAAKDVARQWVVEEAERLPGFSGAFFHGSANWLPDDAVLPGSSDLDIMVVLADPDPPGKPGKLVYRDVLLEVSYLSADLLRSPEMVLGVSHLAGSLSVPSVISDPSGELTRLQAAVTADYAKRWWVIRRCEHAQGKILANLQSPPEETPFHDQVIAWLFAAGVTTHVLLVAGLRNPTVRRRYVATRELLAEYGRLDSYEPLLDILGAALMTRGRVEHHLAALAEVFDAAKTVVRTPFHFASDLSDLARPIAIDGSRELIERGYHREAVFWIAVTYARCQKVFFTDAPGERRDDFGEGFRSLLDDLDIATSADLARRGEQIRGRLPWVWGVAERILAANPAIEE